MDIVFLLSQFELQYALLIIKMRKIKIHEEHIK